MDAEIQVKNMHCRSCVQLIEERLNSLKGIEGANASLAEEKVKVSFDPGTISLEKIKQELAEMGYSGGKGQKPSGEAGSSGSGVWKQGIVYGLVPHIGCIAFIAGSILGVTFLMDFFKPLLLNSWFFYALIGISIAFALIASLFYLRSNGLLSTTGAKKKWKYLSTMFGSTIGINLLFFFVLFPMLANAGSLGANPTGSVVSALSNTGLSELSLQVNIPCSGHAPLITSELKKLSGIESVGFSQPNVFKVSFDSSKTSKSQILALEIFKSYPATVLNESISQNEKTTQTQFQQAVPQGTASGLSSGTCGSSGGCGSSGSSCGCSG